MLAIQAVAAAAEVGMEAEALNHAPRGPGPGLGYQTVARDLERSRSLRTGAAQGCCWAAQRLETAKHHLETSPVERRLRVMATDRETSSVE